MEQVFMYLLCRSPFAADTEVQHIGTRFPSLVTIVCAHYCIDLVA